MGSFSDYLENKILDHIVGNAAFTAPTNIFVALSTADPLDTGLSIAEPFGSAYARVSTDDSDWDAASGGALDNGADITFVEASGAWGTITHFALFDQDRTAYAITGVSTGDKKFTIAGDHASEMAAGTLISIDGSTGNDGNYTVVSATYGAATEVVVSEAVPDATVDGTLSPLGNMLAHAALTASRSIESGDTPKFSAGDLDITLD
jgi:hypothetical protein